MTFHTAALRSTRLRRIPRLFQPMLILGGLLLVLAVNGTTFSSYNQYRIATICVFAIAAIGQDWLLGQAGLLSVGGAAFFALGAFAVAASDGTALGAWPTQLVLAAVLGGVLGLLVGLPALRLKGIYLLLATLAFQFVVAFGTARYQGKDEAIIIAPPHLGSWVLIAPNTLATFLIVLLLLAMLFTANLYERSPGRYWRSIRESEPGAKSVGLNVTAWKLKAFVGSSALTAAAGATYAWTIGVIGSTSFGIPLALNLALMVFIGGRATVLGPMLGAMIVVLLPVFIDYVGGKTSSGDSWIVTNSPTLAQVLYGLLLAVILLTFQDGLLGAIWWGWGTLARRLASEHPPSLATVPPGSDGSAVVERADPASASSRHGADADHDAPGAIVVAGLAVRYPTGAVGVHEVAMSAPAGKIVAVLGRNGAGKTTLLRAIAGFPAGARTSVAGSIRIHGREFAGTSPSQRRSAGLSFVAERDKVFSGLTVDEHLRLACDDQSAVEDVLERFPLLKRIGGKRAAMLSGGERQTLALAAALATKPRFLVVDEPTLGLSPIAAGTLWKELMAVRDDLGLGVIVAEESIRTVAGVADSVVILDGGTLFHDGPVEDLARADVQRAIMGA